MSPLTGNDNEKSSNDKNEKSNENSEFIQKIISPNLNPWTDFIPSAVTAASNLLNGVAVAASGGTNINDNNNKAAPASPAFGFPKEQDMLFDAVPFNGDTDNHESSTFLNSGNAADLSDMDIRIPLDRCNLSNISPIGNVSSRVPFDESDDDADSDDDLDRILGTRWGTRCNNDKVGKDNKRGMIRQHLQHNKNSDNKEQANDGKLNQTISTMHSESDGFDNEHDAIIAAGGCLFEPSECDNTSTGCCTNEEHGNDDDDDDGEALLSWPKQRSRQIRKRMMKQKNNTTTKRRKNRKQPWWKSRVVWLFVACGLLCIIVGVLIAVLVPMYSSKGNNSDQAVAAGVDQQPFIDDSNFINIDSPSSNESKAGIPSPTNQQSPLLRPNNGKERLPTEPPAIMTGSVVSDDYDKDVPRLPQVRLDMGPMVGHTTHESVTLWAFYRRPAIYLFEENYVLGIRLFDSNGLVDTIEEVKQDPERNNAAFATFESLSPDTTYRYEMNIMRQIVGSGSFKTAPRPRSSKDDGIAFEYLLASCMDRAEHPVQKAWETIPTTEGMWDYPDFALLVGDTMYLQPRIDIDPLKGVLFDRYWYRNYEQRTEPHFADFVSHTPTYSTWNNHDYGSPVSNRYQAGKEESLRAWKALWSNPESPGIETGTGIYYSFYWGDVHFIVTDDHWNRDPFLNNRWGPEQTDWIISELLVSTGTFKVIVIGSDIMERGWSSDLDNLGAAVSTYRIDGVLFNAGDIHRNEYRREETGGFPYPVTQITSSGIAKVWRKPFAKIAIDTTVDDPFIRARFFGAATQDDGGNPIWINDPELVCSEILGEDREKEHSCTETIRLSDLTVI